jgi:hypothetical protein
MRPTTLNGKRAGTEVAADPAQQSVTSAAASMGIRRLNPADGLFLRAEHLDQIQTYAGELALLGACGGGSGVVYGYSLELSGDTATAGLGLAFDPSGRALRSRAALTVDLSGLERPVPGRIWIVEVVAAGAIPGGSEPVYSSVCATSCGPESSIQPWLDDAVRIRVRADSLPGDWVNAPPRKALSAIASAYFDRERRSADPWLTPTSANGAIPSILGRPWQTPSPNAAPAPGAVPIGLLAWIDDNWVLDAWSARRDRMTTPPEAAWPFHLGLRPQPVFTAQVLQFQDQLADHPVGIKPALTERFVELPPAGFLPWPENQPQEDHEDWLTAALGDALELQIVHCPPDFAVSAVGLAQHLDRIPLTGYPENRPQVLILVPDMPADLPAVRTDRPGWVAFVRQPDVQADRSQPRPQSQSQSQSQPRPQQASVGVHVLTAPSARTRYRQVVEVAAQADPVMRVDYPEQGWQLLTSADELEALRGPIAELGPQAGVDVLATTADVARQPLAAARARALTAALGLDAEGRTGGVYARQLDGDDAVFLLVRGPR